MWSHFGLSSIISIFYKCSPHLVGFKKWPYKKKNTPFHSPSGAGIGIWDFICATEKSHMVKMPIFYYRNIKTNSSIRQKNSKKYGEHIAIMIVVSI